MTTDYQPIACGFYDELGLRMMRGQTCRLVIENDGVRTVETIIRDVYTEGDAEYARLDDGACVRLDRIRQVDDVAAADRC